MLFTGLPRKDKDPFVGVKSVNLFGDEATERRSRIQDLEQEITIEKAKIDEISDRQKRFSGVLGRILHATPKVSVVTEFELGHAARNVSVEELFELVSLYLQVPSSLEQGIPPEAPPARLSIKNLSIATLLCCFPEAFPPESEQGPGVKEDGTVLGIE